ncbi:MAG: hypothetical protein RL139_1275 [Gemmatimonadota bacterium]
MSWRFAAITILLIVGLRLFAVDAGSGYNMGLIAGICVTALFWLAQRMERAE